MDNNVVCHEVAAIIKNFKIIIAIRINVQYIRK